MHRMIPTNLSREQCLRRAEELEWIAGNCPTEKGAALSVAQARFWRSQALLARPAAEIDNANPEEQTFND